MTEAVNTVERHIVLLAELFQPAVGCLIVSKPPTAYTVTIIIYLRNIPHKVIEYLDFACFVYLVFFIDINFVDEIS